MRNGECVCSVGLVLVLFNAVTVISAFTKCYPVNGQEYCFYTNGSVMSWEPAREFCGRTNSTLPIITNEDIDNAFQQFMSDRSNTDVNHDATEHNSVWLGAEAESVHHSAPWHWINGKTSG